MVNPESLPQKPEQPLGKPKTPAESAAAQKRLEDVQQALEASNKEALAAAKRKSAEMKGQAAPVKEPVSAPQAAPVKKGGFFSRFAGWFRPSAEKQEAKAFFKQQMDESRQKSKDEAAVELAAAVPKEEFKAMMKAGAASDQDERLAMEQTRKEKVAQAASARVELGETVAYALGKKKEKPAEVSEEAKRAEQYAKKGNERFMKLIGEGEDAEEAVKIMDFEASARRDEARAEKKKGSSMVETAAAGLRKAGEKGQRSTMMKGVDFGLGAGAYVGSKAVEAMKGARRLSKKGPTVGEAAGYVADKMISAAEKTRDKTMTGLAHVAKFTRADKVGNALLEAVPRATSGAIETAQKFSDKIDTLQDEALEKAGEAARDLYAKTKRGLEKVRPDLMAVRRDAKGEAHRHLVMESGMDPTQAVARMKEAERATKGLDKKQLDAYWDRVANLNIISPARIAAEMKEKIEDVSEEEYENAPPIPPEEAIMEGAPEGIDVMAAVQEAAAERRLPRNFDDRVDRLRAMGKEKGRRGYRREMGALQRMIDGTADASDNALREREYDGWTDEQIETLIERAEGGVSQQEFQANVSDLVLRSKESPNEFEAEMERIKEYAAGRSLEARARAYPGWSNEDLQALLNDVHAQTVGHKAANG